MKEQTGYIKSRKLAFDVLMKTLVNQPPKSLAESLPYAKQKTDDPAFVQSLAYGVCRYWNQLSSTVKQSLSKQLKEKDQDVLLILAMGIYQLAMMRVPDHAAINETVKLAENINKPWAKGLINGVLRNFQRKEDKALFTEKSKPALKHAHPNWLLQALKRDWSEHWEDVLSANNEHPPFCLRVNETKTNVELYKTMLDAECIESDVCAYSPVGLRLKRPVDVMQLPEFEAGWVSVQDEAAQLSALLFDVGLNSKGAKILDACAAPGGKTLHLSERFPKAEITAVDIDENRLIRIQENIARVHGDTHSESHSEGHGGIKVLCADVLSLEFDQQADDAYDAILIDAPCSGTGVIRRNPDIKWLRQSDDIESLAQQQLAMLETLWRRLKPNGQLLYCTCSILKQENEQVVQAFIESQSDASLADMPNWSPAKNLASVGWQWLPVNAQPDGFYLCLLTKRV